MKSRDIWNRCDCCGRFIGLAEFEAGTAVRFQVTPDSHLTREEYETFHMRCNLKSAAAAIRAVAPKWLIENYVGQVTI